MNRRVSKRRKPRKVRATYPTLRAAMSYARSRKYRVTEVITHRRGERVNVVTPLGPRTLRVGPPRRVDSSKRI